MTRIPPHAGQPETAPAVIESVVALTEQRDEVTLLRSLLEAIREMLPGVEAAILWLVPAPEPGRWMQDEACPLPEPTFPLDHGLLEAAVELNSEASVRQLVRNDQAYVIGSLGIREGRRKLIVLRQAEWIATDLRIAQGMIKIHANYARLLFDSERDTLTGLYNRKKMEQKLGELLAARAGGYHRERDPDTADYLAVFDIDRFKRINDGYGHLIGDEVLLTFAGLVRHALRDVDWVFRYGGEEFVALLKGVPPGTIGVVLDRIRIKVQDHVFPQVGQVTVSVGYTEIVDQTLPPHVFEEADKALYYAKEHGRNQVCDYGGLVGSGELVPEQRVSGSIELF